jgi:peptidoglycan/xylan/chitin deacetylase (PgdA/CDA1 family)
MTRSTPFRFCFTLDTEPDNLWDYHPQCAFESFYRLPAFHRTLLDAGARPTYLTTSEVVESAVGRFAIEECLALGGCEVGAHFHTWTREWPFAVPNLRVPPTMAMAHRLGQKTEEQMLRYTCEAIHSALGIQPRSYRGGRWSFGPQTPESLAKSGIWVDSTVTPGLSWRDYSESLTDGPDFRGTRNNPYYLRKGSFAGGEALIELPVGTAFFPRWGKRLSSARGVPRLLSALGKRAGVSLGHCWLRPTYTSAHDMRSVMLEMKRRGCSVWVFIIHSSEIIPCRPLSQQKDVDAMISRCTEGIQTAIELGAVPATLTEAAAWMAETGRLSY